jgi:hypothetical protein
MPLYACFVSDSHCHQVDQVKSTAQTLQYRSIDAQETTNLAFPAILTAYKPTCRHYIRRAPLCVPRIYAYIHRCTGSSSNSPCRTAFNPNNPKRKPHAISKIRHTHIYVTHTHLNPTESIFLEECLDFQSYMYAAGSRRPRSSTQRASNVIPVGLTISDTKPDTKSESVQPTAQITETT